MSVQTEQLLIRLIDNFLFQKLIAMRLDVNEVLDLSRVNFRLLKRVELGSVIMNAFKLLRRVVTVYPRQLRAGIEGIETKTITVVVPHVVYDRLLPGLNRFGFCEFSLNDIIQMPSNCLGGLFTS